MDVEDSSSNSCCQCKLNRSIVGKTVACLSDGFFPYAHTLM